MTAPFAYSAADDGPAADALEQWPASVKWRAIPVPPLPDPTGPVYLCLMPGERWCAHCGENGFLREVTGPVRNGFTANDRCIGCGSPRLVVATDVLRSSEYVIR